MYTYEYNGKPLHIPSDPDLYLISPVINMGKNQSWTTTAKIRNSHPFFTEIKPLKYGLIIKKNGEILSKLRVTKLNQVFDNIYKLYAEDKLAVLNDSQCRPFTFQGSPEELFEWFIDNHNSQVTADQKLIKGNVTVTDPNDYIVRSWDKADKTWNLINSRLIDKLGGFLMIRYEEDGDYIDWLSEYPTTSKQKIAFGENLIDISRIIDATQTYTACIPYGAENEDGIRLTIESVNDGKDYIVNDKLAEEYGVIYAPTELVTWDDVTQPDNLLSKSQKWLTNEGVMLKESVELSAADLATTSLDIDAFEMYQNVKVYSKPHDIEVTYAIDKMKIAADLSEVLKITIGDTRKTLSVQIKAAKEETNRFVEIVRKINSDYTTNEKVRETVESALEMPTKEIENLKGSLDEAKVDIINTNNNISNEIERVTKTFETGIEQSAENILLEASTTYATKDELTATKSKLEILSNQVGISVETIEKIISTFDFTELGLIIGKSDSEIKSVQDNDSYEFVDNAGNAILVINTKGVNTPTVNVEKQITMYGQWAQRRGAYVDGVGYNLNDIWIGG